MNAVLYIELVIFLLSTGKTQLEAVSFRMSPSWSHGIHTGVTWQCRRLERRRRKLAVYIFVPPTWNKLVTLRLRPRFICSIL
jgi:hypothetical protein